MELEKVLEILISEFNKKDVHYAVIGAYALGLWGVPRATVDLDFLVHRDDMGKVEAIMRGLDYEKRYGSENVSQFVSPLKIFGEVDFLHAFRQISTKMLGRAIEKVIFGGKLAVKVLCPEDIIGLKVQAIANDPQRKQRDFEDMKQLARECHEDLDWNVLAEYFTLFDMSDMYGELRGASGQAD
jgi:hypothetical protein